MERRTVIKGAAGIGAASTAGLTGLFFMSGGAAASLDEYELNATGIEGYTQDGSIGGIDVWLTGLSFSYEGFANEVNEVEIDLKVEYTGSAEDILADIPDESARTESIVTPLTITTEDTVAFNGETTESVAGLTPEDVDGVTDHFVLGDILDHALLEAADFDAEGEEGGGSVSRSDLALVLEVNITDGAETVGVSEAQSFEVTVHNIDEAGNVGGESEGALTGTQVDEDYGNDQ